MLYLIILITISQERIIIDITSPKYKPVPIIFEFHDNKILNQVKRNIGIIGYFDIVDSHEKSDIIIKSESGNESNTFIFSGRFRGRDGELFKVQLKSSDLDAVADAFSNYLIIRLAGIKTDIFGRKLVFLSNRDGQKEIWLGNFPSSDAKKIVSAKSFISSFSISPTGDKIAFIHYDGVNYRLYIADAKEKKIYSPLLPDGMFISSVFFSDSVLTVSWNRGKGSGIYLFDLRERKMSEITSGKGDIIGKIVPGGRKIVFVSGRMGLPQIFVRELDSGKEEKLPLSGNYNTSPDVSPDGKRIVFSKLTGNVFSIYIYDFETGEERAVVTNFGSSENPVWTPDGNFIIFSSNRDGDYDLYITDAYGTFIKKIFDSKYDEFFGVLVSQNFAY